MSELDFGDLTPIELHVRIGGQPYLLREASGEAACKFENARLERTQFSAEGKVCGLKGMSDIEPLLVSLCLFQQQKLLNDTLWRPVAEATIRTWPNRVVDRLFKKCKEISGLDAKEDTVASLVAERAEIDIKLAKLEGAPNPNPSGPTGAGSA